MYKRSRVSALKLLHYMVVFRSGKCWSHYFQKPCWGFLSRLKARLFIQLYSLIIVYRIPCSKTPEAIHPDLNIHGSRVTIFSSDNTLLLGLVLCIITLALLPMWFICVRRWLWCVLFVCNVGLESFNYSNVINNMEINCLLAFINNVHYW